MKVNRQVRGNYIQGTFAKVDDPNGECISRNPGDLEQPEVGFPFSFEHVHEAASAAKRGFTGWRRTKPTDRLNLLQRYRDLFNARKEELAWTTSFEIGKPLWESRMDNEDTLQLIDYHLKLGSQTAVEWKVEQASEGNAGRVRFLSRGPMAINSPANRPVFGPHANFIPALTNGNTVVLKASKLAPTVGQILGEIAHEAGLPAGVFNVIQGDAEVFRRLVSHADIAGILYNGPYETGSKILKQVLSDYWKLQVLETGGKNGMVIWDDCDYLRALHHSLLACYLTSGQRGSSTSRLLVHGKIFDRFLDDFHALSKKARVGYGLLEGAEAPLMGPLVSETAMEDYLRYQGIAVREGCEEIMRGKILERDKRGYYVSPSIHRVPKADPKSVYQKSEIYGPNVAIYRVDDLDEAAEILNQPQYGLVASIYTQGRENYLKLADEARVGSLHWNCMTTESNFRMPHGGIKKSGNSRPMGSFAGYQCTYPLSSIESQNGFEGLTLPAALPRKEA